LAEKRSGKPESLWEELAAEDTGKAQRALWILAADPEQAVPLLRERLRPAGPVDPKRLARLIAELDNPEFAVREQATTELERLGESVLPALRGVLQAKPTPEVRRRLEGVAERLTGPITQPERLRVVRAVAVLEQVGTPQARKVLQGLAEGLPEALLTQEAKTALSRLSRRTLSAP